MANELQEGEIFVVDKVACGIFEVLRITYTKETPKCYVLRGGYRDRHFKKLMCYKSYEDACKWAYSVNCGHIKQMEHDLKKAKEIMKLQDPDYKPPIEKWERFEIMDFDSR
jgi:hypothetical protein